MSAIPISASENKLYIAILLNGTKVLSFQMQVGDFSLIAGGYSAGGHFHFICRWIVFTAGGCFSHQRMSRICIQSMITPLMQCLR